MTMEQLFTIESSWGAALSQEFAKDYFHNLSQFIEQEYRDNRCIYPPQNDIYNAFRYTPFNAVKVVILGQDPYHGERQAHGLAFSVLPGTAVPPSLKNIFKELYSDLGIACATHGDLRSWARQGVLLLNTVLTVRAAQAHSHKNKGWETFTDAAIRRLSSQRKGLVFVLWGAPAKAKSSLIDANKHLILTATHPSPLSAHRGFLGCRHFSKINDYLFKQQKLPIDWRLPAVTDEINDTVATSVFLGDRCV